jgi:hypothetical protein
MTSQRARHPIAAHPGAVAVRANNNRNNASPPRVGD